MKRSLVLLICFVLVAVLLCACGEEPHTHTFAGTWSSDATNHWHAATCEHSTEKADTAAHVDVNNDGACDVCEYETCVHPISPNWTSDADSHWRAPTCGHNIPKEYESAHVDVEPNDGICDVCEYVVCDHPYSTDWSKNDEQHWHAPLCSHITTVQDAGAHEDSDEDEACDICGFEMPATIVVVPITVPDYVKVDGIFRVLEGEKVSFTLTVDASAIVKNVDGATFLGVQEINGEYVYSYEIAAVDANSAVVVDAYKADGATLITAGQGSITGVTSTWKYFYGSVNVNIPSAGTYTIYAISYDEQVRFGATNSDTQVYYTFTATEAGEMTFVTRCFPYASLSDQTNDFTYVVVKTNDNLELPRLEGNSVTMPSNMWINVSVVIPTPGIYQFASKVPNLVIGNASEVDGILTNILIFKTSQANETLELKFKIDSEYDPTYELDWVIEQLNSSNVATLGDNTLAVDSGKFYGFTFTATQAGVHTITVGANTSIYTYNTGYTMDLIDGAYVTNNLSVGSTITFYVLLDPAVDAADVVVNVAHSYYVPSTNANGNYVAHATPNGTTNHYVYTYEEEGEVLFTVIGDGLISLDGGKTWVTSGTVTGLTYNQNYAYLVKSETASNVEIKVEKQVYEVELTVGTENTITLIPGKTYTATLTGLTSSAAYKDFYLVFENANLEITFGLANVATNVIYSYGSTDSIGITYTGEGEAVTVTIGAYEPKVTVSFGGTLEMGYNKIEPAPKTFTCTPNTAGILTLTPGRWVMSEVFFTYAINDGEAVPFATEVKISMNAGDTITIEAFTESGTGYASLTAAYTAIAGGEGEGGEGEEGGDTPVAEPDGTVGNPFVLNGVGDYSAHYAGGANLVWHTITLENGAYVTVSSTFAAPWLNMGMDPDRADSNDGSGSITAYYPAGAVVYIGVGDWGEKENDVAFTVAVEEVVSDAIDDMVGTWFGLSTDDWGGSTSYTLTINPDGTGLLKYDMGWGETECTVSYVFFKNGEVIIGYANNTGASGTLFATYMDGVFTCTRGVAMDSFVFSETPVEGGDDEDEEEYGWLNDGENEIVVTDEDLTAGVIIFNYYTGDAGEYKFASNNLLVTVKTQDGETVGTGTVTLDAWTQYLVEVNLNYVGVAGNYALTISYSYPAGAQENPIQIGMGDHTVTTTDSWAPVWHSFVASATGTITVTTDSEATLYLTAAFGSEVEGMGTVTLDVISGRTYYLGIMGEGTIAFNVAFAEGEIELDGSKNLPYELPMGDFVVNVPEWEIVVYMYTATADGTLKVTCLSTGYDFSMSTSIDGLGYNTEEATLTMEVVAGDIVYVFVSTAVGDAGELSFNASVDAAPTKSDVSLSIGENSFSLEENSYAESTVYAMGNYTITWATENLVVVVNGVAINSGDIVAFPNPRLSPTTIVIYGQNYAAVTSAVVTIAEYVAPALDVVVGENTISTNSEGVNVEFTAPVAGTFTIVVGVNGVIDHEGTFTLENEMYTLEVTEGQVVSFVVLTMDYTESDVVITIVEGDGSDYEGGDDNGEEGGDDNGEGDDTSKYETIVLEGANTLVFSSEEIAAGSASRDLIIVIPGIYSFRGDLFVSGIVDLDGNSITKNTGSTYTLQPGEYVISFGMFSMVGISANEEVAMEVTYEEIVVDEGGDDEGGSSAGASGTYVGMGNNGRAMKVIIDAEAGTMSIIRAAAAGNSLDLAYGATEAKYNYSFDGTTVTYSCISGQVCTCTFDANGVIVSVIWGSATYTGFAPEA